MKKYLILLFSLISVFGYTQTLHPNSGTTALSVNNANTLPTTVSGTNTYTATLPSAGTITDATNFFTDITDRLIYYKFTNAATSGPFTLNLNSEGAKTLKKRDATGSIVDIVATDIAAGQVLPIRYNGTYLVIEGGSNPDLSGYVESVTGDGVDNTDAQNPEIDITSSRTVTGTGAVVQTDNLHVIYFDSGSPFNFTIDALTINSQVAMINVGAGTVTFINGSGVTFSGASTLAEGESTVLIYQTSTAPRFISGGGGVTSPTHGGTGVSTVTTGDLLYGSATNVWSKLSGVATGNALISGGVATAPSWGKVTSSHVDETVYKAGGNNASGSSVLGLTSAQQLTIQTGNANMFFDTNASRRFTLKSDGLAFIGADGSGGYSSSTEKFVVNMNGLSINSTTNGFSVKSNTSNLFRITTDGRTIFGNNTAGNVGIWQGTSNSASPSPASTDQIGLVYGASTGATVGTLHLFRNGSNQSNTSGDGYGLRTQFNWDPTSGTGNFSQLSFEGQINQTSTASGTYTFITDKNISLISSTGVLNGIALQYPIFNGLGTATPNSRLHVNGSFSTGYVAKTATYTATVNDHTIECTANTFTVTLPTAVGIAGRIYVLVNSGAGTITLGTTSSQTFVNVSATPTTLTKAGIGTITVQSNGANWLKLSEL